MRILALALALCGASAGAARAELFASQAEALASAFPTASRIEKRTLLLDDAQVAAVEARAQATLDSHVVTVHTAWREGSVLGYAFIDVHDVRTLPEALLVVISPEGQVADTRMLAFYEPQDYLPPARWLEQFRGKGLDGSLRLGGAIHGVAGATLSSRAVTQAVRRSLALYEVLLRPAPSAP